MLTSKEFMREFEKNLRGNEKALYEVVSDHFKVSSILLRARYERGLTQTEVAKLAKIRQSDVSRYECGEKSPSLPILFKLSKALGIEMSFKIHNGGKAQYRDSRISAKVRRVSKAKSHVSK